MTKTLTNAKKGNTFKLDVDAGDFSDSEIVVLLGENGTGKTTFIRMLAGLLEADSEETLQSFNQSMLFRNSRP